MGVHRKKHNKKFIHTQNHFNEHVVIELVFKKFHPYEKSRWLLKHSSMYISNEPKILTPLCRKPPTIFHIFQFIIRHTQLISHGTITAALPRINHIRRYEKKITHDDYQRSTKPIRRKRLEIMEREENF